MKFLFALIIPIWAFASTISVQVLGSGGPEAGERTSAAYLIKKDSKAVVVIDFGAGSLLRFSQAGAKIEDLKLALVTHLHIDHIVELPAFMKAGYFSDRTASLPIIGPSGNNFFPGFKRYIELQFGKDGAYRYMSDILTSKSDSFSLKAYEIKNSAEYDFDGIHISAVAVNHGIVPAMAYRVEIEGHTLVFSGDTSAHSNMLTDLAKGADILIAHHAIPEHGHEQARGLHMTPSRIAKVADEAKVKTVVLSHRMHRTIGLEKEHEKIMRMHFKHRIIWAEDLLEIPLEK